MAIGLGQVVSWYICTIVACLFLGVRLFIRLRKLGKLGIDDGLIILSASCLIADLGIQQYMWNLGMADIGNASADDFVKIMKMIVPGSILYVSSLWAIKFALVIFYKHLAAPKTGLQILYNVALGILGATYLIIFFNIIFQCYPEDRRWSKDPNYQCDPKNAYVNYWITVTMNIATDVFTLSLPISMVLRLQMKMKQKIGVCAIFCLGFLVVIASIIRAYFSKRNKTMLTCTVSMIETAVAIIATCLPPLRTLILGHFSTANSGSNYNYGNYELSGANASRRRTQQRSRNTTNIVGRTQNPPNDSEDELVTKTGRLNISHEAGSEDGKSGITVSRTFQLQNDANDQATSANSREDYNQFA